MLWPGLLYKGCQGKHDKQNQSQPWLHIFTVPLLLISPKSFLLLFSLNLAKCSNFTKTEVIESFHCKLLPQTGQASSGVTITSCETEQVLKTDFLGDKYPCAVGKHKCLCCLLNKSLLVDDGVISPGYLFFDIYVPFLWVFFSVRHMFKKITILLLKLMGMKLKILLKKCCLREHRF